MAARLSEQISGIVFDVCLRNAFYCASLRSNKELQISAATAAVSTISIFIERLYWVHFHPIAIRICFGDFGFQIDGFERMNIK